MRAFRRVSTHGYGLGRCVASSEYVAEWACGGTSSQTVSDSTTNMAIDTMHNTRDSAHLGQGTPRTRTPRDRIRGEGETLFPGLLGPGTTNIGVLSVGTEHKTQTNKRQEGGGGNQVPCLPGTTTKQGVWQPRHNTQSRGSLI